MSFYKTGLINLIILLNTLTLFSQDAEKLFESGFHYLKIDYQKAVNIFSESIRLDSCRAETYYYRGIGHFKLGNYDSSLFDFKNAEQINPNIKLIPVYKAFIYRKWEHYDSALYYFTQYVNSNPHDTVAFSLIMRGKLYSIMDDYDGAITDFQTAIDMNPVQESFHYYKYKAHFDNGEFNNAIQQLDKVIQINPNFYGYHFFKGKTYFEMSKYKEAVQEYSLAIDLNVSNADLYYHRGLAEQARNNINDAILDYDAAIAYNDKEGLYFFQRGHAYMAIGDKFKACNDWYMAGGLGFYKDFDKIKQVCE